jgi:hypothetical protein
VIDNDANEFFSNVSIFGIDGGKSCNRQSVEEVVICNCIARKTQQQNVAEQTTSGIEEPFHTEDLRGPTISFAVERT